MPLQLPPARLSRVLHTQWPFMHAICCVFVVLLLPAIPVCGQPTTWSGEQHSVSVHTQHTTANAAGPEKPSAGQIAASRSRLIVRLRDEPLIRALPLAARSGDPELSSFEGRAYLGKLQDAHTQVSDAIQNVVPGAVVEQSYHFAFSGLAVWLPVDSLATSASAG
jgi:hypothetical protein